MKWRWYEIIRKKNSRFTQHKVDANTLQIRLIHTLRLSITGQRQIELRKSERLLWHFVSSRVNQLIFFYFFGFLFVLRISISEFQHFKRCSEQQNPRYAYTELTEENKNRDFLFSYDRSIFFFLLLFFAWSVYSFRTKKFRCLLLYTLHFSSILNYLALEADWTCVISWFDGIDSTACACIGATIIQAHIVT